MEQRKQLKDELVMTNDMKMLTTAYQEHALEQINIARYSVLASRDFAIELTDIFSHVRMSYNNLLGKMLDRDKKKLAQLRKSMKNGKQVHVLVSANNKLYGDLIPKICRLFLAKAKETDADLVIIGRDGKNFVDLAGLNKQYKYFEIPDTGITEESIKPLTAHLVPYESVTLYCGRFNNVISQEAIAAAITGENTLPDKAQDKSQAKEHTEHDSTFLFEPSIEYVMDFFETQIFSIILSQTISEAQLARFGSRIKAMETAHDNLEKLLEKLSKREKRLKTMETNKKQIEVLSGRRLWGKR